MPYEKSMPSFATNIGNPEPLGATRVGRAWNFAAFSNLGDSLSLRLFDPKSDEIIAEFPLHQTDNIFHIQVKGLPKVVHYAYFHGDEFLDPYAKAVASRPVWKGEPMDYRCRSLAFTSPSFNWKNTPKPKIPKEDLVIYEMHVRGLSADPSCETKERGTFAAIIEKIPYFLDLGINAIEMMPVFEFDELSYKNQGPVTGASLCNFWGYSPINFFSPMRRYSQKEDPTQVISEFKEMVRELHKAGIEILLDVVYNHVGSHFFAPFGEECYAKENYSGCGHTLNTAHPDILDLILSSLRYWANEMQVDGFRFDLASIMTRGIDGTPLSPSPLIEAISLDPILSQAKLIAEPWDCAGLYQLGQFPQWGPWSEWNGQYRDTLRSFIKGTDGYGTAMAQGLSGSSQTYTGSPLSSINFITAHDGFTLHDLVSYNEKHNEDNGEDNRDGNSSNLSWNCGIEGPTANKAIISLRTRQMRNFMFALFVSQGTPMILAGDEMAHTALGNNNRWCHDNPLNWLQWSNKEANRDFFQFCKKLIFFRKKHPLLRRAHFLTEEDITWHGYQGAPNWSEKSRFLAYTLIDQKKQEDLFIAFNASHEPVSVTLPLCKGRAWQLICDTAKTPPFDFYEEEGPTLDFSTPYTMTPYSALLLKASQRK